MSESISTTRTQPPNTSLTPSIILASQFRSPVYSLCRELYGTIFLFACPSDARAHAAFIRSLLLVSKDWNAAALASLRIWTTITVDTKFHEGELLVSHVQTSLRRAGSRLPLTLMLKNVQVSKGRLDEIYHLFGGEKCRVHQLAMSADDLKDADGHIAAWDFPHLVSVSIHNGSTGSEELPYQCALPSGVNISRLTVVDHRRPFSFISGDLPKDLETLDFTIGSTRRGELQDFAASVSKCSKLWYLALTGKKFALWKSRINSKSLRYLKIDSAGQLFKMMPVGSMPNLTHLRIIGASGSWGTRVLPWPLMERLESLDAVGTHDMSPPYWIPTSITRNTPNLKELRVPLHTEPYAFGLSVIICQIKSLRLLQVFDNITPNLSPYVMNRGQEQVNNFASRYPKVRVEWHASVHDTAVARFELKNPMVMKVVTHSCAVRELGGWPFRTVEDVEDKLGLVGAETPEA